MQSPFGHLKLSKTLRQKLCRHLIHSQKILSARRTSPTELLNNHTSSSGDSRYSGSMGSGARHLYACCMYIMSDHCTSMLYVCVSVIDMNYNVSGKSGNSSAIWICV